MADQESTALPLSRVYTDIGNDYDHIVERTRNPTFCTVQIDMSAQVKEYIYKHYGTLLDFRLRPNFGSKGMFNLAKHLRMSSHFVMTVEGQHGPTACILDVIENNVEG